MTMSVYKTYTSEVLSSGDLNASFNRHLTYERENRDYILGDNAEGTGVTAHDHQGTYGKKLTGSALADSAVDTDQIADDAVTSDKIDDDAVVTAAILDANVTWAKLAAAVQRYIVSDRLKHSELVYQDDDLVTISFPWTEPGGTAWSNVTGLDISKNVSEGGHVKEGVTKNGASTWYYLYISNSFTISQPVSSEFLFTDVGTGETGYTLLGAVYNNSGQVIEPFVQFGDRVLWDAGISITLTGSGQNSSWTDTDLSDAMPATSRLAILTGKLSSTINGDADKDIYGYVRKNGILGASAYDHEILAGIEPYGVTVEDASGNGAQVGHKIVPTDSSQVIEYCVSATGGILTSATLELWVNGYFVR